MRSLAVRIYIPWTSVNNTKWTCASSTFRIADPIWDWMHIRAIHVNWILSSVARSIWKLKCHFMKLEILKTEVIFIEAQPTLIAHLISKPGLYLLFTCYLYVESLRWIHVCLSTNILNLEYEFSWGLMIIWWEVMFQRHSCDRECVMKVALITDTRPTLRYALNPRIRFRDWG